MFSDIVLINYSRPLRERQKSRRVVGPYHWSPSAPTVGRGWYADKNGGTDSHDSTFRLRVEEAKDVRRGITGYYCDRFQDETLKPIIFRLAHGVGFLAGWTMGNEMIGALDRTVWDNERDASEEAHRMAERDAEAQREYEEAQQEEEEEEEEEEEGIA